MKHQQPTQETKDAARDEFDRMVQMNALSNTRAAMTSPLLIVFIYALVQLIWNPLVFNESSSHYIFMIVGSVISFFCVTMYTRTIFHPRSNELLKAPPMTIAYVVIFLFACYITFYQGFWGFAELTNGFSVWVILKSILAIIAGRNIAIAASHISDQVKNVRKI